MSKVSNRYLRSKLSKRYLKVQDIQKVTKGPRYLKGTKKSKVSKRHLKVQASGLDKHRHQYHDSAWPRGQAE